MNPHIGLVPAMMITPRIDQINQYLAEQRQQVELSMQRVHQNQTHHQTHHQSHHRESDLRDQSYRDRERRAERRDPRDRERRKDRRSDDNSRSRERSRERSRRSYDSGYQGSNLNHEGGYEDSQGSYDGSESRYSNHSGPNDDYYGHSSDQRSQDSDDFERNRERSRDSRDRDRDRGDRDREDRDRGRNSRERDRDRDHSRQEKGGEKWMTETPTNTILLRGLPSEVDENDIRAELMMFGAPIKEVRLMKRKDTGVSRGFAFVEFQNLKDAQRWMELNQGQMRLLNQYTVNMYYSTPKTGAPGIDVRNQDNWTRSDWTCSKCGAHNFKRRDYCFKCSISKEESERAKAGDGFDQVGNNPCNTLIFRGLDALTTEENIIAALAKVTSLAVKNIKVIRDDLTGTSQGFGFLEMNSLADSTTVVELIKNQGSSLEVDGKAVLVSYAKNTFSTVMATMKQTWTNAAGQTWDYSQGDYSSYYQQPNATGSETTTTGQWTYDPNTGQYYDAVTGQWYDYSAYYEQTQGSSTQSDTTNAAAAVAQAAIQHAQAKQYTKDDPAPLKSSGKETTTPHSVTTTSPVATTAVVPGTPATTVPSATVQVPGTSGALQTYPVPDVSTYQYDETSGYYYDPTTTLYYDPNSQYYYNSTTGQFLYWDGDRQTYLPAPMDGTATHFGADGILDDKKPDEKCKKDKEKKEKVKIAKKIAKDMEKWAKSMNAQKESARDAGRGGRPEEKESASADAGYAILEKRATVADNRKGIDINLLMNKDDKKLMPPPPGSRLAQQQQGTGTLVASYGGDSEEEDDEESGLLDENKLLDLSKMACLLCKRQFPNKEALTRHTQLSDLHKNNLEELRKQKASRSMQYRDRAKERRAKYGVTDPPVSRRREESAAVPYEEPTKAGLKEDNIGNKLLQKMGWSQGQGLGRANQGIVDPVQATHRQMGAGLGSRGSAYQVSPGDSYKDSVKKVMYQRFQELE